MSEAPGIIFFDFFIWSIGTPPVKRIVVPVERPYRHDGEVDGILAAGREGLKAYSALDIDNRGAELNWESIG
jgi:hypothetical protein